MRKLLKIRLAATILSFSLLAAVSFAEEAKQEAKVEGGSPAASASQETLFDTETSVGIGYQGIGFVGNSAKYQQYTTPPKGFFLDSFTVHGNQKTDTGPSADLDLHRPNEDAFWLNGSFRSVDPILSVNARGSVYRFFFEPAPAATLPGASYRKVQDYSIKWSPMRAVKTVKVYGEVQQVSEPKFPGYPAIAFESGRIGADLLGGPAKTPVTLSLWDDHFGPEASLAQPRSRETHVELGWTPYDTERSTVGLSYLYNRVNQEFVSSGASSHTLRLSALAYPITGLVGQLTLNRINVSQPLTANGYSSSYNSSDLDVRYSQGPLSLRGGIDYRDVNHVNGNPLSGSTNPVQKQYYAQVKRKFGNACTFTARYDDMDLSAVPVQSTILTSPTPLYFTDEQKIDYRIDATPWKSRNVFLYAGYNRTRQSNSPRGTNNAIRSWVLGGYGQLNDKIALTLDFSRQEWDGDASLSAWLLDSRVTTLGLSYAYDPKTWLNAAVTTTRSIGASDSSLGALGTMGLLADHVYEASLNRTINKDFSVGLTYRYQTYDDTSEAGMNFHENQLLVSLKANM